MYQKMIWTVFSIGNNYSMTINVQLHTIYQKQTQEGLVSKIELPFIKNQTLEMVISLLDIKLSEGSTLLVVNGKIREMHYLIQDGDSIHIIPAISGGQHTNSTGEFSHD